MDNDAFKKLDLSSFKMENIDTSSLFKMNANHLLSQINDIEHDHQRAMKLIDNQRRIKEEREEENRANLRATVESLDRVNEKLEEQIKQKDEDLQNQRDMIQMLRQQLFGINRTLSDLFIIYENNQEKQEEIRVLAQEIYSEMILGKKPDWKAIALHKGVDIALAAVPIILELAKVL